MKIQHFFKPCWLHVFKSAARHLIKPLLSGFTLKPCEKVQISFLLLVNGPAGLGLVGPIFLV